MPKPAARIVAWLLLGVVVAGSGCAMRAADVPPAPAAAVDPLDADTADTPQVWDPIESVNRRMLRGNLVVGRFFLDPLSRGYAFVVPDPARRAVQRAFLNLWSPAVFVNDVLQLAPVDATVTLTRLVVNTTVGVAGLFDPAAKMGLDRHETDFGQTLALYGVPSGPYIVLPVLGPTTVRDGSGYLVDLMFQPTTYVLPGVTLFIYASIHQSSAGLVALDEHAAQLHALEASSVDFYAALRSAYYQDRVASIEARSDKGPKAFARLLGALSLGSSRREVGDLAVQHGGKGVEAVALER